MKEDVAHEGVADHLKEDVADEGVADHLKEGVADDLKHGVPQENTTDYGGDIICLYYNGINIINLLDVSRHNDIRKAALKCTRDAAEKMTKQYNASKKIKTCSFNAGDAVTVRVPSKDRGPCDMQRVPGVVVNVSNGFNKIRTQFGALKTRYRSDALEKCAVRVVEMEGWESDNVLTLREAARKFNKRETEVSVCKCKSNCLTKRCICIKQGVKCTTRCHSGNSCDNVGKEVS